MNPSPLNLPRLEELTNRYIDRCLTKAEMDELSSLLHGSPEARSHFWQVMQFEGVLAVASDARHISECLTSGELQPLEARARGPWWRPGSASTRPWWMLGGIPLGLTGLAVALAVLLGVISPFQPQSNTTVEPTSTGLAVLANSSDVQWQAGQKPVPKGSVLLPGRIQLTSGVLGIEFYNGVRLTVEGPADFDLRKVDEVLCHFGKLRVHVPQLAHSFRVLTPDLDLLDLGTEFGLDVQAAAKTEVHVFEGKVAWSKRLAGDDPNRRDTLAAGEGVRAEGNGISPISARPDSFISRHQLDNRVRQQVVAHQIRAEEATRRCFADPRLVLYYGFQEQSLGHGLLRNQTPSSQQETDGVVVGCEWGEGRFPGRTALVFRQPSDRVRVNVPGEFESLTYVAWIQINRLDHLFSSIFLTDGFEPGKLHWQITRGRLRLGIGDSLARAERRTIGQGVETAQTGVDYDTEPLFSEETLGRWCQFIVVVDGRKGEVRHYWDGKLVGQAPIVVAQKLRIGSAELGNWGLPKSADPQPIRNLNGRVDEFMIFAGALSKEEIDFIFGQQTPEEQVKVPSGQIAISTRVTLR